MYGIICEGMNCKAYEKCLEYEEKHGKNKCMKKKKFQVWGCHNDERHTCNKCNNFQNCMIPLKYNEKVEQIQYRIAEILKQFKKNKGDENLKEELIELQQKEKEKIKYLQRRYKEAQS